MTIDTSYTYDVEHQLIRIDLPGGGVATYRYDGLGRRIEKAVDGAITRYLYDDEDIWALATYDGTTHCATHRVLHGPGIDQPLAFQVDSEGDCDFVLPSGLGETLQHLQTDGLGSITSLTTEPQTVPRFPIPAERYNYDSFGTPQVVGPGPDGTLYTADDTPQATSAFRHPYRFTGREYDPESGLYYSRARYYDPQVGRFLQGDPIAGDALSPTQRYAYVQGNPVNLIDPYGDEAITAGAGMGLGAAAVCAGPVRAALCAAAAAVAAGIIIIQQTRRLEQGGRDITTPHHAEADDEECPRNPAQDKKLTQGEIDDLEKRGIGAEELKEGAVGEGNSAKGDLYKDPKTGDIYVKPKSGKGPGVPTGENVNG